MLSLLLVFFSVAIVTSFLCSLWEAVLLSITPAYARLVEERGDALGQRLEDFKANIDRPLAAILTLNTIAHTVGAIGVGQQAALIWSDANPLVTTLLVPAAMTLAVLILSEIVPKTLGANYWQELTPFTVRSLSLIITLLYPLVWGCQLITRTLNKSESASVLTRSEFLALAELGERDGVFDQAETAVIGSLLRFQGVAARDVMTPRMVVRTASEEQTIAAFVAANPGLRFSRIPVYRGKRQEDIAGYILRNEALERQNAGAGEELLASIRRPIRVVSENCPLPELFNSFLQNREHIALVMDDYGGMAGLVTMEDVIETLLGLEIVDESDEVSDMQTLARRNWESRARSRGILEWPAGTASAADAGQATNATEPGEPR
jgi:CBS domain containing-hemolysin-like protein